MSRSSVIVIAGVLLGACFHATPLGGPHSDGGPTPFTPACDAASLPDGGQWAVADFADCSCRCPDGTVNATPLVTCSPCYACACNLGSVDLSAGCVTDADCVLAPADCCGCENGGSSVAIRVGNLGAWLSSMSPVCGGVPPVIADGGPCSGHPYCSFFKAVCDADAGRCTQVL